MVGNPLYRTIKKLMIVKLALKCCSLSQGDPRKKKQGMIDATEFANQAFEEDPGN